MLWQALSAEVQQAINMESHRFQQTSSGKIDLERGQGKLKPISAREAHQPAPDELEPLSLIIAELNERFGLNLGPEHQATLQRMTQRLDTDRGLAISAQVNPRDNVRLTFDQKVEQVIHEIVELNFELYKKITDDLAFGTALKDWLFDRYLRAHRLAEALVNVKTQVVAGKLVGLVSCQRSREAVFIRSPGEIPGSDRRVLVRKGRANARVDAGQVRE